MSRTSLCLGQIALGFQSSLQCLLEFPRQKRRMVAQPGWKLLLAVWHSWAPPAGTPDKTPDKYWHVKYCLL